MKSHRLTVHAGSVLTLAVFLTAGCSSRPPAEKTSNPMPDWSLTASKIKSLLSDYEGSDRPGAALMVTRGETILLQECLGMSDLEKEVAVQPETNFRLASVTKQFTAMAVMILADEKKLTYDTRLTEIFSAFPEYGSAITIRNLLQHTSGLVDYETLLPDTQKVQVRDRDVLRLMMEQDSTYFEPGSEFRYSNSGYAVLAMAVEEISHTLFAEFLAARVFRPLGMTNTVAFEEGVSTVPHRAYGYSRSDPGWVRTDQSSTSAVLGDGGIYTSLVDLVRWLDLLQEREVLIPRDSLSRAFLPALLNNGEEVPYGYGRRLDEYRGKRRIYHGGSTRGFRNNLQWFPDEGLTVVFLSNRNEISNEMLDGIVDLLLPPSR
ncbi:MAG: serine hydrolase domain-containing protein [Bacteroidota bacterium]